MDDHHRATLERAREYFASQPGVLALLLGGSIAHGFATAASDVDVMVLVTAENYAERQRSGQLTQYAPELATYADGYVDAKFVSPEFLDAVEERGGDAARFAFADAQIVFAQQPGLAKQLQRITRYPEERQAERLASFAGQLHAWHWFVQEADKKGNAYLLNTATSKLLLFGARLILAHNRLLYPFHKWLRAQLARAPEQPAALLEQFDALSSAPSLERASAFYASVAEFQEWPAPVFWPVQFLRDSELNWWDGAPPVEDL